MLTLLSFGGGQDSTAILFRLIKDKAFRAKYVQGELVVVMADTGAEFPYTYEHVERCKKLCEQYLIPFFFIKGTDGFHRPSWTDLYAPQCREPGSPYKETLVVTRMKACTINLKIDPIYKFMDEYINEKYSYGFKRRKNGRGCNKQALKKYYEEYGHLRVIIGFSKGEEKRVESCMKLQANQRKSTENWEHIIDRCFPLVDVGMDRHACVEYIERYSDYEVMPSNCMLCPYQSKAELLWLYKNFPEQWEIWVAIEQRKIERYEGKTAKNYGVYATKKLLPQLLEEAKEKFGHLSDEQLHQHKKYHGCQTNQF